MRDLSHSQEIVALIGAHSLGRCHTDRSGFDGPWTNAPTTFSNLYFQVCAFFYRFVVLAWMCDLCAGALGFGCLLYAGLWSV